MTLKKRGHILVHEKIGINTFKNFSSRWVFAGRIPPLSFLICYPTIAKWPRGRHFATAIAGPHGAISLDVFIPSLLKNSQEN